MCQVKIFKPTAGKSLVPSRYLTSESIYKARYILCLECLKIQRTGPAEHFHNKSGQNKVYGVRNLPPSSINYVSSKLTPFSHNLVVFLIYVIHRSSLSPYVPSGLGPSRYPCCCSRQWVMHVSTLVVIFFPLVITGRDVDTQTKFLLFFTQISLHHLTTQVGLCTVICNQ